MKTKYAIALLAIVGVVGSTQAAWQGRVHWKGGGAAGVYYDAANWMTGAAGDAPFQNVIPANTPGLEYDMFLDNSGDVTVSTNTLVNIAHLGGAVWADATAPSDVTLTINGGNIETVWWMVLGEDFGSSATINMNGGSLTVGTHPTENNDLMLGAHNGGSGTLNMNAGTVTADILHVGFNVAGADVSQQTAELNLAGGTVNAGALFMNTKGYIDITGGTLVIDGDARGNIHSWITAGSITAFGGTGTVLTSYDGSQTQVSAVHTNVALYSNPLVTPPTGADPFVLKHEGIYYLYCTAENHLTDTGIPVYTSTNLVDWVGPAGNGPSGLALHENDVWGDTWFWGGDVIEKDGTFYMYATVEEHLVVATSDSPLGPFTQAVKEPMHSTKEIDSSVFSDDDGKYYIYYVRFENGNVEYVAELSDDLLSMKEETITFCLRAQSGTWERGPNPPQASVLEGAYAVKHNGVYYLIYTANHFASIDYSMGYATSASPFGPWTRYSGNPILQQTANLHGPGNGMVIDSPDGSEMFLCYHVHYDLNNVGPRRVALDRIWFEADPQGGIDILVLNGPTVALQRYPSNAPPIGDVALAWIAGTGDLALTWNTGVGYLYALQSKSNLVDGTWADDTTGIMGAGGDVTVTTTVGQVQSSFYRIILE